MKRQLLAAMLSLTLVLSGCWSRIEVNDLAIVGIIALDQEQDGGLRVSLQILTPQRITHPGGPSAAAGARPPFMVVSDTGPTVPEAVRRMQLQLSRRIFLAHANVILIGEALARSGLGPIEDFLTRSREIRPTSNLLVVEGEALEMLHIWPSLERQPADAIAEVLRTRIGIAVSLREYARDQQQEGVDPVLPWLGVTPAIKGREAESATRNFLLKGSAVFVDDRLVGWLHPRQTRNLLLLKGQETVGILTTPMPKSAAGQWFSTDLTHSSARRQVIWRQHQPAVTIQIGLITSLRSLPEPLSLDDPAAIESLQGAVEEDSGRRIQETLEYIQSLGADPFGFGLMIRNSSPSAWRRLAPNWREQIRRLPVSITMAVRIGTTGLTSRSRTAPEGAESP